jgi:hypothetical protein
MAAGKAESLWLHGDIRALWNSSRRVAQEADGTAILTLFSRCRAGALSVRNPARAERTFDSEPGLNPATDRQGFSPMMGADEGNGTMIRGISSAANGVAVQAVSARASAPSLAMPSLGLLGLLLLSRP